MVKTIKIYKWDSIAIMIIAVAFIAAICFAGYLNSLEKFCYVEIEGETIGVFDLNVNTLQPFTKLTINKIGGKAAFWIPCSKLGG